MNKTLALLAAGGLVLSRSAFAAASYQTGHITRMTTINTSYSGVLIALDSGLPDNCAGTPYGWMWIPTGTTMAAYVLGLWLEGGESTVTVSVYTTGLASNGFCEVSQIAPSS